MTAIRPALITRLFKAVQQKKLSDAVLLLTQVYDGTELEPMEQGEHFMRNLREAGEQLEQENKHVEAEQHLLIALSLYDRFYPQLHFDAIAIARRLAEMFAKQGREADVEMILDLAYIIVQRMLRADEQESQTTWRQGAIANTLVLRHQSLFGAEAETINAEKAAGSDTGPIHVLLVEDSSDDANLVHDALSGEENHFTTEWASYLDEALRRLSRGGIDVVLLDLSLPDSQALESLRKMRQGAPDVPIVVFTGVDDRDTALRALKSGARDYLVKGKSDSSILVRSLLGAVEHPNPPALVRDEQSIVALIENSPLPMMHVSNELQVETTNAELDKLVGASWSGRSLQEVCPSLLIDEPGLRTVALNFRGKTKDVEVATWRIGRGDLGWFVQLRIHSSDTDETEIKPSTAMTSRLLGVIEEGKEERATLKGAVAKQTALATIARQAQLLGADINSLCTIAAQETARALDAEIVSLLKLDDEGTLFVAGAYGIPPAAWSQMNVRVADDPLISSVMASEPAVAVEQFSSEEHTPKSWQQFRVLSAALCRIGEQAIPFGVIAVLFKQPQHLPAESLLFVHAVAAIVATAAEKATIAEDLALLSQELQRSNADLQQFAYAAAHDLQEPLRSVVSYLDLLTQRYGDVLDEKASKYISVATAAAKRMQALINDLLQYSRVSTRAQPFQPVDCNNLLAYVWADVHSSVEEAGATLDAGDLPVVVADPSQLAQVFLNLISNAIKFRSEEKPRIVVRAEDRKDEWLFSLSDNGIGFSMEYSERIFGIFQRLHTRARYSGTGIGLALCKKIIEHHGGRIWVESTVGKGTTFYFTLPKRGKISD